MEILLAYAIAALPFVEIYLWGVAIYWACTSFLSGLAQSEMNGDFSGALIWPISLMNVAGLIVRGIWDTFT